MQQIIFEIATVQVPKVFHSNKTQIVATLLWKSEKMTPSLPKWGLGGPPGFLKFQSSIARVKTPRIEAFIISLESY
jgi:hypothetical protein